VANRSNKEVFKPQDAREQGFETRDVLRDDFGFEIPTAVVPLPSRGSIYDDNSGLANLESLEIRAMTAKEEDILTSRALIKKGTVINELIKSCLIDKKIRVNQMIAGDRNAIMVALRVTGYGADYKVDVDCPSCAETSTQSFDLATLPIKRLGAQPLEPNTNMFEFQLPVSGKRVQFKFLTGVDEREMEVTAERKKKLLKTQVDSLITSRLIQAITSIEGVTDKNKISAFIRVMPAGDSRALRKYFDDIEPGIDMQSWISCPNCSEESQVRMPLGASFFWPDA